MLGQVAVIVGVLCAAGPAVQAKEAPPPKEDAGSWAEQLTRPQPEVRLRAVAALAELGPAAKAAVPILAGTLRKDKDLQVRRAAAVALGQVGPDAAAAVPALTEALADADYDLVSHAARALGHVGPKARAAVPALTRALRSRHTTVCYAAAGALGGIGPQAREAGPELRPLLTSVVPYIAASAAESLWRIDRDPEAIRELIKQVRERTPINDGCWAAEALGNLGPDAAAAVPALREALKVRGSLLPTRAAVALWRIGKHKDGIAVMTARLRDGNSTVRSHAATALGLIGPAAKAAVPALTEALKDTGPWVAPSAAEALERIDPGAAKKAQGK
jgi:HEAT repeat protein